MAVDTPQITAEESSIRIELFIKLLGVHQQQMHRYVHCLVPNAHDGPADLEILTPMKCVVHSGRVIAKVPTGQEATVTVFQGRVDAVHRTTGHTEQMSTVSTIRFQESNFQRLGAPAIWDIESSAPGSVLSLGSFVVPPGNSVCKLLNLDRCASRFSQS